MLVTLGVTAGIVVGIVVAMLWTTLRGNAGSGVYTHSRRQLSYRELDRLAREANARARACARARAAGGRTPERSAGSKGRPAEETEGDVAKVGTE